MTIWPLSFNPPIPAAALYVHRKLVEAGYECLLAGGWVRDLWMGYESCDVDLATSARPDQVVDLFSRTLALGKRFGSVVILVEDHGSTQPIEVTSFRSDGHYLDGRRPEQIYFSDAPTDAQRRDFTINGLFYDPLTNAVIDYIGGLDDLDKKVVRAIGEPMDRFQEDKLRILRAVRFATRFSFDIEPKTAQAIKNLASTLVSHVSAERIYQELTKMSTGPHLACALQLMHSLELVQAIFGHQAHQEFSQTRLSLFLQLQPKASLIFTLSLLWPLKDGLLDPRCILVLESLKISGREKKHLRAMQELCWLRIKDPQIYLAHQWLRWLSDTECKEQAIDWLMIQADAPEWKEHLVRWMRSHLLAPVCIAQKPLLLASDLEALQLAPGKALGKVLQWLFEQAARLNITHKATLVRHLQSHPYGIKLMAQAKAHANRKLS